MNLAWPTTSRSREASDNYSDAEEIYGKYTETKKPVYKKIKHRRYRMAFTTDQINYLESVFKKGPYVNCGQRQEIAQAMGLTDRCVKVWFQNRRMREKQMHKEQEEVEECHYSQAGSDSIPSIVSKPSNSDKSLPALSSPQKMSTPSISEINSKQDKVKEKSIVRSPGSFRPNYYQDISQVRAEPSTPTMYTPRSLPVTTSPSTSYSDYKASAEFSIDLCKKYKKILTRYKSESNIASDSNNSHQMKSPISHDMNKLNDPLDLELQDVPEDLSIKKLDATTKQASSQKNNISDNKESLPVYAKSQHFVGDGNLMWNRLTIPTTMANTVPAAGISIIPADSLHMPSEYYILKEKCNCCKCPKKYIPAPRNQTSNQNSEPKYIINVVPYQNYPKL